MEELNNIHNKLKKSDATNRELEQKLESQEHAKERLIRTIDSLQLKLSSKEKETEQKEPSEQTHIFAEGTPYYESVSVAVQT
jgi:hypothetical protein